MPRACTRVTLRDVANASGFALSTVSGVLNRVDSCFASQEARRLILATAEHLGYEANPVAVALSRGRTRILGVVMDDPTKLLGHPEGAHKFSVMLSQAAERGHQIMVLHPAVQETFPARLLDGCFVWGLVSPEARTRIAEMAMSIPVCADHEGIPGATLLRAPESETVRGYRMAAEYLYGLGHRHVAVVEFTSREDRGAARFFREVAEEKGMDVTIDVFVDRWQEAAYPSIERFRDLRPRPTAVFAFDDSYAKALMARLWRDGVKVPQDLSVFSGETGPAGGGWPVTTGVAADGDARCREIVNHLIRLVSSDTRPDVAPLAAMALELRLGETCGPPHSAG